MSLTNDPLIIEINKRIDTEIGHLTTTLAHGGLPDFSAYKKHCGIIYGLNQAKDFIEQAIKKFTDDED
jgi:hypothetical protein